VTYSDAVVLVIDDVDFAFPAAVRSVPWHSEDPAEFEAADLRYCHFPSRVTFSVGDAVVMGPTGVSEDADDAVGVGECVRLIR
jgi:hypothetical protein